MSAVIRLNQVSKFYGRQAALDKVTLEIPQGVVFALLGENGAGKTTAIRIMLGLCEPDEGTAQTLSLDCQRHSLEIRRRIGYVAERPTLYEWMTVGEIGWFIAGFYGDGYITRYRQLAEHFQLPLDKKIKHLSKGGRAKVSLSLAMAHEPELLILDEPTSGLDAMVRRDFLDSMADQTALGRTVLLSSHQINEVERVADMVGIIKQGKLLLAEPLDTLKSRMCELTITLAESANTPPSVAGEVLRQRRRNRQWQILVRDFSEEQLARLRASDWATSVDTRTPNLEEIFLALMQCPDVQPETFSSSTSNAALK
jgi:ABC-2 type transport system ATP-binding protein